MDTNNGFLKHWFSGINSFIDNGESKEVEGLLSDCAKKCSESYPLKLYRDAFQNNCDLNESLLFLSDEFSDFAYTILPDKIQIMYRECGCDLYLEGLIDSRNLCICSEKSLLYCWESIFGKDNVRVKRIFSIINGDDSCKFDVQVKQLGHFS